MGKAKNPPNLCGKGWDSGRHPLLLQPIGGSLNWTPARAGDLVPFHNQRSRGHTHTDCCRKMALFPYIVPRMQGADILLSSFSGGLTSPREKAFQGF